MFAWLFSREQRRLRRINRERRAGGLPELNLEDMRRGVSSYNRQASMNQVRRTNADCDDFLIVSAIAYSQSYKVSVLPAVSPAHPWSLTAGTDADDGGE